MPYQHLTALDRNPCQVNKCRFVTNRVNCKGPAKLQASLASTIGIHPATAFPRNFYVTWCFRDFIQACFSEKEKIMSLEYKILDPLKYRNCNSCFLPKVRAPQSSVYPIVSIPHFLPHDHPPRWSQPVQKLSSGPPACPRPAADKRTFHKNFRRQLNSKLGRTSTLFIFSPLFTFRLCSPGSCFISWLKSTFFIWTFHTDLQAAVQRSNLQRYSIHSTRHERVRRKLQCVLSQHQTRRQWYGNRSCPSSNDVSRHDRPKVTKGFLRFIWIMSKKMSNQMGGWY